MVARNLLAHRGEVLKSNRAPRAHDATKMRRSTSDLADRTWMIVKVLSDMGHRDEVEADSTTLTAAEGVQVPGLNVALLILCQASKLDRSSVLVRKMHSGLDHVAGAATVVSARAVAVFGAGRVAARRVKTSGTRRVHRALQLRDVVRTRKGLLSASKANLIHLLCRGVGDDETRAAERGLLHHRGVPELLNKSLAALDGRIRDFGSLVRLESWPETTLDAVDEHQHAVRVGKVDEGIAHVAAGVEINP